MSYLWSLPAMEDGEVRSVVALKPGVGDHAPERFADHELGSHYRGLDLPPDLRRSLVVLKNNLAALHLRGSNP
jgi:hypothetical protein